MLPTLTLFLALVRSEPDWRELTVDLGDEHRLGGFLLGGEPERLVAGNFHGAAEVGLPQPEVSTFLVREGRVGSVERLPWIRRVRAQYAREHLLRARDEAAGPEPQRESVDWTDELATHQAAGDDEVSAAADLVQQLMDAHPGPLGADARRQEPGDGRHVGVRARPAGQRDRG